METVRVKPCAVNSTRLVQWRKSRPPIFDRTPGTESASRDPAIRPLSRRFSVCSGGRGTSSWQGKTYSAQRVHRKCRKRKAEIWCDLCFALRAEKDSVRVLSVSFSCWLPTERRRSNSRGSLSESFQDWRSTLTQSSVTVLRDLRQRMVVRFCDGRNDRPTIFALMCQEKRDRRSPGDGGAHSQFSDGDSYPHCGGGAKVARKVLGVCGCA
jgi:hypothetical protein